MADSLIDIARNADKTSAASPPVFKDQADQQAYLQQLERKRAGQKVKLDPRVDPANPGAYSSVVGTLTFKRDLAKIRDGIKKGSIDPADAAGLLREATTREAALLTMRGNFGNRFIQSGAKIMEYSIPAAVNIVKSGVGDLVDTAQGRPTLKRTYKNVVKPLGESYFGAEGIITNPAAAFSNNPVPSILGVAPLVSAPASVLARSAAVQAAAAASRGGALARAGAIAKAAAAKPPVQKRYLNVPGVDEPVQLVAAKNPALNAFQRNVIDRRAQAKLDRGGSTGALDKAVPGFIGKNVGAEARAGAALRAKRQMDDRLTNAEAVPLTKYGKTLTAQITGSSKGAVMVRGKRLSDSEQKAVGIALSNVPADVHIAYHTNRFSAAKTALQDATTRLSSAVKGTKEYTDAVNAVDAAKRSIAGNEKQIALSIAAKQHLDAPSAVLNKAIAQTREVSLAGTSIKKANGLSDDTAAFRIGAEADELTSGAAGEQSLFKQYLDLDPDSDQAKLIRDQLTLYGQSLLDSGAAYVPKSAVVQRRTVPLSRRPGRYGITTNMQGKPYQNKQFKAGSLESGDFRIDATNLVHDDYLRASKWASLDRALSKIADLPEIDPNSKYALFVRDSQQIPDALKRLFDQAHGGLLSKRDEQVLSKQLIETLKQHIVDPSRIDPANLPEGVKAVDGRLGKFLTENAQTYAYAGDLGKMADNLNNLFRAGLLYSSPKYALNLVQGLGTNVIQQGVFAPKNWKNALTLGSKLSEPDMAKLLSVIGDSATRSLNTSSVTGASGAFSYGMNRVAEFWNTVTDRVPRVSSFLHEAASAGYKTPESLSRLLNDPALRDDLFQIQGVANKAALEFGNLSPVEQNAIRRAVFFYPWLRAASKYTARFPVEHPYQAGVLQSQIPVAQDVQEQAFGGKPPAGWENWIPVGGGNFINVANVNTPLSPAEFGRGVAGLFQSGSPDQFGLLGNATPVLGFGISALTGLNSSGLPYPDGTSHIAGAAKDLWSSLPPVAAVDRAKATQNLEVQPEKQRVLPTGPSVAVQRYFGGGFAPLQINTGAAVAKREAQYIKSLPPTDRVSYKSGMAQAQVMREAADLYKRGVLKSPEPPQEVLSALYIQRRRDLYTIEYARKQDTKKSRLTSLQKAEITLDVLLQSGRIDQKYRDAALVYLRGLPSASVPSKVGQIWSSKSGSGVLSDWNRFVRSRSAR